VSLGESLEVSTHRHRGAAFVRIRPASRPGRADSFSVAAQREESNELEIRRRVRRSYAAFYSALISLVGVLVVVALAVR
jgi:hypothetical protein